MIQDESVDGTASRNALLAWLRCHAVLRDDVVTVKSRFGLRPSPQIDACGIARAMKTGLEESLRQTWGTETVVHDPDGNGIVLQQA